MAQRDASGATERAIYRRALWPLALNAAGFAFLETAVIPALPIIQKQLHAHSATSAALLESAYLAVASVAAPLLGKFGDKLGKKGPLLWALGIYLFGAVNAGFCGSMGMLIPFRALQGAGGAVLALSVAIIRDRAPEGRMGSGIGFIFGAFGLGMAAGFGLSDVIATGISWRWIFWFGSAFVAVNFVLVAWRVPASERHPQTRIDGAGTAMLAVAIALLIAATAFGQPAGWGRWYIVEAFVLSAAAFWCWFEIEKRREQPLLDVRVLASPGVLLPNVGALLSGFAAFAMFLLVPRFVHAPQGLPPHLARSLQYGLGAPRAAIGLYLLPVGCGVAIGGPSGGAIGRRWGGRWPFMGGLVILAVSAMLLVVAARVPIEVLAWTFLAGLGFGASAGASATLVAEAVPHETVGIASAFNSLMRLVGGGVGAEVGSAVFSANLVARSPAAGAVASHAAFEAIYWTAFGLALLAAMLVLLMPSRQAQRA